MEFRKCEVATTWYATCIRVLFILPTYIVQHLHLQEEKKRVRLSRSLPVAVWYKSVYSAQSTSLFHGNQVQSLSLRTSYNVRCPAIIPEPKYAWCELHSRQNEFYLVPLSIFAAQHWTVLLSVRKESKGKMVRMKMSHRPAAKSQSTWFCAQMIMWFIVVLTCSRTEMPIIPCARFIESVKFEYNCEL